MSFIADIEIIEEIPKLIKTDDGYAYPKEYQYKLFKTKKQTGSYQFVFLDDKTPTYIDFGVSCVLDFFIKYVEKELSKNELLTHETLNNLKTEILENVNRHIVNNIDTFKKELITQESLINLRIDILHEAQNLISNGIDNFKNKLVNQETLDAFKIEILEKTSKIIEHTITYDTLNDRIDEKLQDVFNSFKLTTEKLVNDEIMKIKLELKNKHKMKPKISSITSLIKEEGFTVQEVKQLAAENLI